MALIYNTTNELQSVKVFGNWFSLKPGQMKNFDEKIAHFIATERRDSGLVALPEAFEDPQFITTDEGKAILAEKREEGIKAYIDHFRKIIANNQIALRQDLERSNIKADPATFASDGELHAMEMVAKYQRDEDDKEQKRIDRVKELMKTVGPSTTRK